MQTLTLAVAVVALVGFGLLTLLNAARSTHAWKNKSTEPPGPTLIPWVRLHVSRSDEVRG